MTWNPRLRLWSWRSVLLGAIAAASSTADIPPAHACSCIVFPVDALPGAGGEAPLDTHVYLELRRGWLRAPAVASLVGTDGTDASVEFALATADGARVRLTRRFRAATNERVFLELVPAAPLRPQTRYRVVASGKSGRSADLTDFVTTGATDRSPPQWAGVTDARIVRERGASGLCRSGEPFVALEIATPTDDGRTPTLFAIWAPRPGEAIDYVRPPSTYVQAIGTKLTIGRSRVCVARSLELPTAGRARWGLRAVDIAGNMSPPAEVSLDFDRIEDR